jgi:hypothetical protein
MIALGPSIVANDLTCLLWNELLPRRPSVYAGKGARAKGDPVEFRWGDGAETVILRHCVSVSFGVRLSSLDDPIGTFSAAYLTVPAAELARGIQREWPDGKTLVMADLPHSAGKYWSARATDPILGMSLRCEGILNPEEDGIYLEASVLFGFAERHKSTFDKTPEAELNA